MVKRKRIVTYMHTSIGGSPVSLLLGGSRTATLAPPHRVFEVREVAYDDNMTPIYSTPNIWRDPYPSLEDLRKDYKHTSVIFDAPILDRDNNLKSWHEEA